MVAAWIQLEHISNAKAVQADVKDRRGNVSRAVDALEKEGWVARGWGDQAPRVQQIRNRLFHGDMSLTTSGAESFISAVVIWLRLRPAAANVGDRGFIAIGAASGVGSALLGSVGPLVAPFFLARGLVRGAYIGTEAATALVMHITKLTVFGAAALLTLSTVAYGLLLTPASIAGSYVGKRIVDRLPVPVFTAIVEIVLIVAGILMITLG